MKLESVQDYRRAIDGLASVYRIKEKGYACCHRYTKYTEFSCTLSFAPSRPLCSRAQRDEFCSRLFPKVNEKILCPCGLYTREEIAEKLHKLLAKWEVDNSKYLAVCVDPTPTMIKGKQYIVKFRRQSTSPTCINHLYCSVRNDNGVEIHIRTYRMQRTPWRDWRKPR